MGKKNKTKVDDILKNIAAEQKKLEKRLKEVPIDCYHLKKNGMLKGDFKGEDFKCGNCSAEFSFGVITNNAIDEAAKTLTDAINQIKVFTDDPESDYDTIHKLGLLAYNISEFTELYKRAMKDEKYKNLNKKKKGKHKDKDRYSYGGYGSLSFIANGNGNKKKKDNCW